MHFALLGGLFSVELQGHWEERFGGTCLGGFSLRRACTPTRKSVLEEVLCFGVAAALILARLQGHWGQRFGGEFSDVLWQCRSCITIMSPKVDEVGPKMAPTQPQDSQPGA